VHAAVAAMRAVSDQYAGDPVLIGEVSLPIEQLVAYYGPDLTGFHLPFNFHLIKTDWTAEAVASLIRTYEAALPAGAWPNWVIGNHDRSRPASRIGPEQARVAAMLLLTLRGTPTIYQGEEIGMANVPIPPERVQDPWEKNVPGIGLGRDPVRTPMQWDASPNAAFTASVPWLPLAADHAKVNVAVEAKDPRSMLSLYRDLIALRRSEPALSIGGHVSAEAIGEVLIYERRYRGRRVTVALNFGGSAQELEDARASGDVLLSTYLDGREQPRSGVVSLRAHEGIVIAAGQDHG
jgi:alpha-glucosidase